MKTALANSLNVYIEAAGYCLRRPKENLGPLEGINVPGAWQKAYDKVKRPVGVLDPDTGEELVGAWQRNLLFEMKKVCEESTKPELFFAARLVNPEVLKQLK